MSIYDDNHRMALQYRKNHPPGTRIELLSTSETMQPVPIGTRGIIHHIDDQCNIHMLWDNGRTQAVIPGEDSFRKLTAEELAVEQNGTLAKLGDDCKIIVPNDMVDFQKLNALANHITVLSPTESVKFKAVLEAESPQTIDDIRETADSLWQYEMTSAPHDPDTFYKQYMRQHLDSRIDAKWIDTLILQNEGATLIDRLGGALTDYGVISARGVSLYAPVPYDAPSENKEIKSQALTDEKLDVIEVLDRKALFSNGRVMPEELPAGLYAYDLRMNDDQDRFVSIEKSVMVNHGGTLLFKEALDLGVSGRIPLTFDTEPNFLGEELTPNEFLNEDIEESETQTQGGMSL